MLINRMNRIKTVVQILTRTGKVVVYFFLDIKFIYCPDIFAKDQPTSSQTKNIKNRVTLKTVWKLNQQRYVIQISLEKYSILFVMIKITQWSKIGTISRSRISYKKKKKQKLISFLFRLYVYIHELVYEYKIRI